MTFDAALIGSTRYEPPACQPSRPGHADFSTALGRAYAVGTTNETPEHPITPRSPGPAGAAPSQPVQADTEDAPTAMAGGGARPPTNSRPVAASTPDPEEIKRVIDLLKDISAEPLRLRPAATLNDYASAMLAVHRSNNPPWLKQACNDALTRIIAAGGVPRPPMSMIAQAAVAPSLGMKAGLTLASLLNYLPVDELKALPAAQRDNLFAKFRALRADPRLDGAGQDRNLAALVGACQQLRDAEASLIPSNPFTRWDEYDIRLAPAATLTKLVAPMTDAQIAAPMFRPIANAAHYRLSAGATGMPDDVRLAAQVQADRILALHSVPSQMQPIIDRALADFPHLHGTMLIAIVNRRDRLDFRSADVHTMHVTTGTPPPGMEAEQGNPSRNAVLNVTIAKIAYMDDYMIDQSATEMRPSLRRPGETKFQQYYLEATVMAPPGTEVRVGMAFQANYAQFTLPPMDPDGRPPTA